MNKLKCLRCLYEWNSRVENPRGCPRCKNYNWWIEENSKCNICNKTFLNLVEHHIDGDRTNHSSKNRIAICSLCHNAIHNLSLNSHSKGGKSVKKFQDYLAEQQNKILKYRQIWLDSIKQKQSTGGMKEAPHDLS